MGILVTIGMDRVRRAREQASLGGTSQQAFSIRCLWFCTVAGLLLEVHDHEENKKKKETNLVYTPFSLLASCDLTFVNR